MVIPSASAPSSPRIARSAAPASGGAPALEPAGDTLAISKPAKAQGKYITVAPYGLNGIGTGSGGGSPQLAGAVVAVGVCAGVASMVFECGAIEAGIIGVVGAAGLAIVAGVGYLLFQATKGIIKAVKAHRAKTAAAAAKA